VVSLKTFPIHISSGSQDDSLTLGLRIDPDAQIKNDKETQVLAELPAGNLKEYMLAFYTLVIENLNRPQLTKFDWERTVSISDGDVQEVDQ